jgi:hypothetical protein
MKQNAGGIQERRKAEHALALNIPQRRSMGTKVRPALSHSDLSSGKYIFVKSERSSSMPPNGEEKKMLRRRHANNQRENTRKQGPANGSAGVHSPNHA